MNSEAVDKIQLNLLKELFSKDFLKDYYLAGGTNLALRYRHRKSIDLDLFSYKDFNIDYSYFLHSKLQSSFKNRYVNNSISEVGVFGFIDSVKTDFVNYNYELIKPTVKIDNIVLADIPDIAAMKLGAVTGRGSKKDFYDIFELLKHFKLSELLKFYKKKYGINNISHVLKSLVYFKDAELIENTNNTVISLNNVSWEKVKEEINIQVKDYLKIKRNKGKKL